LLPLDTFAPGMSFEEVGFTLLLNDIAVGICIIGGSRAFGTERRLARPPH